MGDSVPKHEDHGGYGQVRGTDVVNAFTLQPQFRGRLRVLGGMAIFTSNMLE